MSGTTSVPAPTFGPAGFVAPARGDVLSGVQADMNSAFGGNMNPALETPQGQLASSFTAIIGDKNDQFAALTQGVDPAYASGRMQDGIARIYFIERNPAQSTVVQALCSGISGVSIPSRSLAQDANGNLYSCVSGGVIGVDGTVTLSFACTQTGPIACPANTLTTIYRSIVGWDSITNPTDGALGNDVETRAEFELRRQQLVSNNAVGSIPAVQGSVLSVAGILDAYTTDNPTGVAIVQDGVTIPPNALYVCVAGGSPIDVASAIWRKKAPGCPYAGNTTVTVLDTNSGYSPPYPAYNVTFQTAIPQQFVIAVNITNSQLIPSDAATQIQNAVIAAFAGSDGGSRARIGSTIYASRYYAGVASLGSWAEIVSIKLGSTGLPKAVFAASISGTLMTVTAISSGVIAPNQMLVGTGISIGVKVVSFGTGVGGTGTYNISVPQAISPQQITAILADLDTVQVGIAHIPVLSQGDITVNFI